MLAKRLARRGVVLSGGALAAVLLQNVASAGVPTSVVSSTIKAASLFAAGQAAAMGVISAKVAALSEGMLKAMLLTKIKIATVVVLMIAALAGAAGLIYQTQAAEQPKAKEEQAADKKDQKNSEEKQARDVAKAVSRYVFKSVAWIVVNPEVKEAARGTGTLIDRENRLLLTTYDLVHGGREFAVIFPRFDKAGEVIRERKEYLAGVKDKNTIYGKVLAFDRTADLALIQLDRVPDGVEALPLARNDLEVGDDLHLVGPVPTGETLWVDAPGAVRKVYTKQWIWVTPDKKSIPHETQVIEADLKTKVSHGRGTPCVNQRGALVGVTVDGEKGLPYCVEVSECERFVKDVFKAKVPALTGKTWERSERPLLPKREK